MVSSQSNLKFKMKRPSKKAALIAVVVALLLIMLAVGGYFVWKNYYAPKENKGTQESVDEARQNYLKQSENLKLSEGASVEDRIANLIIRARSSSELGNHQAAIDNYNLILALPGQDQNTDALFGLAETYEAMGDKAKAKESYQKIMQAYLADGGSKSDKAYTVIEEKVGQL